MIFKPLVQILFEISCWQDFNRFFQRGITPEREITQTRKKYESAIFPWWIHMKFQNLSMHEGLDGVYWLLINGLIFCWLLIFGLKFYWLLIFLLQNLTIKAIKDIEKQQKILRYWLLTKRRVKFNDLSYFWRKRPKMLIVVDVFSGSLRRLGICKMIIDGVFTGHLLELSCSHKLSFPVWLNLFVQSQHGLLIKSFDENCFNVPTTNNFLQFCIGNPYL